MLKSDKFQGVYLYGSTSTGKTYEVINALTKLNKINDTKIINSHITPLSLFITLQQSNNKIILLDDVDNFNDTSIALLKSCCWDINGERRVTWLTTSRLIYELGLEKEFLFTGKIIITSNSSSNYKSFEPVLARMLSYEKYLSLKDIADISIGIFNKYDIATEFVEFKDKWIKPYIKGLHLRNILKYCEYIKAGHKDLCNDLFEVDEMLEAIHNKMDRLEFIKVFDCTIRTYQRYAKKYKNMMIKYE